MLMMTDAVRKTIEEGRSHKRDVEVDVFTWRRDLLVVSHCDLKITLISFAIIFKPINIKPAERGLY